MAKVITSIQTKAFSEKSKSITTRSDFRFLFFDSFDKDAIVPDDKIPFFYRISERFYKSTGNGYGGIMKEITDRIEISKWTGKPLKVNDFLKHTNTETDLFDPSIHKALEKKTGCGDWLIDKNATTLEKAIAIYKRKKRLLRWDYDFIPSETEMNGKKSVNKNLSKEEQEKAQERLNPKKAGKQYPIHIHIETTYSRFFEYLALYPSGIATFFKLSTRTTDENGCATCIWQLQTIKNSKKKIAFLEHFNTWDETGLTLEEYETGLEE